MNGRNHRTRRNGKSTSAAAITTVTVAAALAASLPAQAQVNVQVVMNGLDNARGMAIGPNGNLYVAEAGNGGSGTSIVGGDGSIVGYGTTGGIAALNLSTNAQTTVLSGAPSLAIQTPGATYGTDAAGISGIVFVGNTAYGVVGYGGDPSGQLASFTEPGAAHFDQLVSFALDGSNTITNVANLGAYEAANNPDGNTPLNSNPYNLAAVNGGFVVADAGGNDVLGVTSGGAISTLYTIPPASTPPGFMGPPTYQGVPTDVAVDPLNGKYYFTELTGYPFTPGSANIYVYDPTTGTTSVAYSGFTTLTGLTFDASGDLYALEYSTLGIAAPPSSGQIIEIGPTGTQTTLLSTGLVDPTAILYDNSNQTLYVTNNADSPSGSQVLAITAAAAPEPGALALLASAGMILPVAHRRRKRLAQA